MAKGRRKSVWCTRHIAKLINILHNSLALAVWGLINVAVFWRTYYKYKYHPQYYYLYKMLGDSLCWSRGSASVLCLSCSFILLPVCRNIVAWTRKCLKFLGKLFPRAIDRSIWFHRVCALTIMVASVVHTGAHLFNASRFSSNFNKDHSELNFASYKNQDIVPLIVFSIAGSTGIVMIIVLFIMIAASLRAVRQGFYELFWYTHHLFVVFFVLLAVHGLSGVIKHQVNLDDHVPGCKWNNFTVTLTNVNVTSTVCRKQAEFVPDEPEAWKWILGPICLYLFDRAVRVLRSRQQVNIVKIIQHSCNVVEVQMTKEHFNPCPGQYVFLNCSILSKLEWHPFTITKCPTPEDETFSIHFKIAGNWTSGFVAQLFSYQQLRHSKHPLLQSQVKGDRKTIHTLLSNPGQLRVAVDGPYGSPFTDIFEYEVSLCIATGIGVTPFAAVIHDLRQKIRNLAGVRMRRIYFVWVCREMESFQWFADLLVSTHHQLWHINALDFFICNLYVTQPAGGTTNGQSLDCQHLITDWLGSRITTGRPNWKGVFQRIANENPRTNVGVFYCGNRSVSSSMRKICQRSYCYRTNFVYNKEILT